MNKQTFLFACVLTGLSLGLVGCFTPSGASAPVNFYRLDYPAVADAEGTLAVKVPAKILVKVSASPVLKGPRIIVMDGAYEVDYAESRRWAEPIPAAFTRIVVTGLRQSYATVEGVPTPASFRPDYRVNITVEKLWGTRGGQVVLQLSWQIADAQGAQVGQGHVELTTKWNVGDYRQLAERLSGLMPQVLSALGASLSSLDAGK